MASFPLRSFMEFWKLNVIEGEKKTNKTKQKVLYEAESFPEVLTYCKDKTTIQDLSKKGTLWTHEALN